MLLSELFNYVVTLDSSSLDLDTNGDGVVKAAHYPKVINAINLGLTHLYMEFPIRERSVIVQLYDHITNYTLSSQYADTNTSSNEVYKYIEDSAAYPFEDDVSIILSVTNEIGTALPINDSAEIDSIYTPYYNVIQHPYPNDDNAISVIYKAKHQEIPINATAATYVVDLPMQVLPILLLYVNHKLLAAINKEESMAKLNEYIGALNNAKTLGLFTRDAIQNDKLWVSGWV